MAKGTVPVRTRVWVIATLMSGLLTALLTNMQTTAAGFTDTTSNLANSWQAGAVTLANDYSASSVFSSVTDGDLTSGGTLRRCVTVTYTGDILGSTVIDDFSSLDGAKWNAVGAVTVTSGALVMTPSSSYEALNAVSLQDMRDAALQVQAVQVPNVGNGSTEAFIEARIDANNRFTFGYANNQLIAGQKIAGVYTQSAVTWNAATMKYWRIKTRGTTVDFDYSTDEQTWTNVRSLITAMNLSSMRPDFSVGYWGTEPAPGVARFDNYSYTPTSGGTGVRMYGSVTGGTGLGPYLALTIERATSATPDCATLTGGVTVYSGGTLTDFTTAASNYATGVGWWEPTTSPTTRVYRITAVASSDPAAASKTVAGQFTWEAQSR